MVITSKENFFMFISTKSFLSFFLLLLENKIIQILTTTKRKHNNNNNTQDANQFIMSALITIIQQFSILKTIYLLWQKKLYQKYQNTMG